MVISITGSASSWIKRRSPAKARLPWQPLMSYLRLIMSLGSSTMTCSTAFTRSFRQQSTTSMLRPRRRCEGTSYAPAAAGKWSWHRVAVRKWTFHRAVWVNLCVVFAEYQNTIYILYRHLKFQYGLYPGYNNLRYTWSSLPTSNHLMDSIQRSHRPTLAWELLSDNALVLRNTWWV